MQCYDVGVVYAVCGVLPQRSVARVIVPAVVGEIKIAPMFVMQANTSDARHHARQCTLTAEIADLMAGRSRISIRMKYATIRLSKDVTGITYNGHTYAVLTVPAHAQFNET